MEMNSRNKLMNMQRKNNSEVLLVSAKIESEISKFQMKMKRKNFWKVLASLRLDLKG